MILVRWLKGLPELVEPEPVITINVYADEEDAPPSSCRAQAFAD
jgi:hypothetical protein